MASNRTLLRFLKSAKAGEIIKELNRRGVAVRFNGENYLPTEMPEDPKTLHERTEEINHENTPEGKRVAHATIGKNLASTLSRSLVRDKYAAIAEMVCNAYDADARTVRITVDSLEGKLVIEDDGEGMDVKGLTDFFRLGDSAKVDNPISPGGRRRIGKFGIATVLLEYLGSRCKVESVKEGRIYSVEDTFAGEELRVRSEKARSKTRKGTKITIRDLKFKIGKEDFDPKRLCDRLNWDVPNVPDFDVIVDDRLVRKRRVVEYSSVYEIDTEIGGEILTGRLYFQHSRGGNSNLIGVRIYVDGRGVGDASIFRPAEIDERLERGLSGVVNADFLRDSITLDRSQFQEHDPRLSKVIEAVRNVMRLIINDVEHGKSRRGYYEQDRIYERVEEALHAAEYTINERTGRNGQDKLSLSLDVEENSGKVARFDPERNTIHINVENPMLVLLPGSRRTDQSLYLERAFCLVAAHALTNHDLEETDATKEYDSLLYSTALKLFAGHTQIANQISKFLKGERKVDLGDIRWCQARLYDHFELANMTGRPTNLFRYLFTSGAMGGTEDGYFRARQVVPVLERIEGYVPCIQVVDPKFSEVDRRGGAFKIQYTNPKPSWVDKEMRAREFTDLRIIDIGVRHPYHFVPVENRVCFAQWFNGVK